MSMNRTVAGSIHASETVRSGCAGSGRILVVAISIWPSGVVCSAVHWPSLGRAGLRIGGTADGPEGVGRPGAVAPFCCGALACGGALPCGEALAWVDGLASLRSGATGGAASDVSVSFVDGGCFQSHHASARSTTLVKPWPFNQSTVRTSIVA